MGYRIIGRVLQVLLAPRECDGGIAVKRAEQSADDKPGCEVRIEREASSIVFHHFFYVRRVVARIASHQISPVQAGVQTQGTVKFSNGFSIIFAIRENARLGYYPNETEG